MAGWRAVCLGIMIIPLAPMILIGVVILIKYVPYWWFGD